MRRRNDRRRPGEGRRRCATWCAAVLLLAACSGGDSSGIGSGGSGSASTPTAGGDTTAPTPVPGVTVGAVAGYGSVIVNGLAWDETHAVISADDGTLLDASSLLLGKLVAMAGTIDPQAGRGTATTIVVARALAGRVDALDGSGRPVVLGLPVAIDAATALGSGVVPAQIRVGDRITVYGALADEASAVRATRVDRAAASPVVREGLVSARRTQPCGFSLGVLTVDCSGAAMTSAAGVADGARVRVYAIHDPAAGTLVASRVELIAAAPVTAGARVSVEGVIGAVTANQLVVRGYTFDVSTATVSGAPAGGLSSGLIAEVSGVARTDGIVQASTLKVETADETEGREFEATGTVTAVPQAGTIVVRETSIDTTRAQVSGGTSTDLVVGVSVEVHGRLVDGVVRADEIEIRH